jgi:hypothetical protein
MTYPLSLRRLTYEANLLDLQGGLQVRSRIR